MNPADEYGHEPTQAEVNHDFSDEDASQVEDDELDTDNSPLAQMLSRIYHLPSPSGKPIARVRLKGRREYTVRQVNSGGIFAYDCSDTRMVIPICDSMKDLPSDEVERDETLRRIIRMQRNHYES